MRFARASIWALALCVFATSPALAQVFGSPGTGPDGPYLRGEGGWSHQNDMRGNSTSGATITTKQSDGYLFGGAAGWKFDQLRLELGLDFANSDIKTITVNGASGSASGSVQNLAGMVNAFWDFRTGTNWVPYIGLGVGASRVKLDNAAVGGTTIGNSSDTVFAYQPMVGVNYFFTPNLAVGAQYRYFATVDPSFSNSSGGKLGLKNESHNVLLGLTWYLGAPRAAPQEVAAPMPPPPPPAPAPVVAAPAPAPAPDVYVVFFDNNRATLTAEGRRVVEQAAATFNQNGKSQLQLTGYTDTTASQNYNLALSRSRAFAVRDYLVRLGVPEQDIGVAWKGEAEQRVPTGNNVREPQNRRVEIVIP